jgi:hypothetical protein
MNDSAIAKRSMSEIIGRLVTRNIISSSDLCLSKRTPNITLPNQLHEMIHPVPDPYACNGALEKLKGLIHSLLNNSIPSDLELGFRDVTCKRDETELGNFFCFDDKYYHPLLNSFSTTTSFYFPSSLVARGSMGMNDASV